MHISLGRLDPGFSDTPRNLDGPIINDMMNVQKRASDVRMMEKSTSDDTSWYFFPIHNMNNEMEVGKG
jgi:hypothetical protein